MGRYVTTKVEHFKLVTLELSALGKISFQGFNSLTVKNSFMKFQNWSKLDEMVCHD